MKLAEDTLDDTVERGEDDDMERIEDEEGEAEGNLRHRKCAQQAHRDDEHDADDTPATHIDHTRFPLSLFGPDGFAFLQEGGDALAAIGAGARFGNALRGVLDHRPVCRPVADCIDQVFRGGHGGGAVLK